ncbi:gpi transamidase component pig-s [Moniliophthora roreri]|uniref:GPI transamidase component PIG-S n=1 Tax=Moniliophthora roreri TaxID=221103 RepID=A0A0W0FRA9_MONRR|nr:gpi transamidase component pig-s [Moniliophthora roreri]
MDVNNGLRDPSTIFYQHVNVRRAVIASYWIVLFLAMPLWWKTTSIERLSLPTSEVNAQAGQELKIPVKIALDDSFSKHEPHFRSELQTLLQRTADGTLDIQVTEQNSAGEVYEVLPSGSGVSVEERRLMHPVQDATPTKLADTLSSLFIPSNHQDHRMAQYASRYRLSFTLLNEDASGGQVITGWDVSRAISGHIKPILSALSVLHNFTIESQVQYYAPLAFEPKQLPEENRYGLTPEDLTVFINSAEWTLSSSSSNDPVLHFVLFVPSANRRPLTILNAGGKPSGSNAFLIPQWGGIVIADLPDLPSEMKLPASQLTSAFSAFSQQLLTLLGVPRLPAGISSTSALTPWQIDALLRQRTSENIARTRDTLRSTVSLVEQIENMPVGEKVRDDVQDALKTLGSLWNFDEMSSSSLRSTLQRSGRALTLSQRAFFHPGMLALLYFPAEHKYAVYTPLFVSATIPMLAGALREIIAWKRQRRQ